MGTKNFIYVCAQYREFPFASRKLCFSKEDVDMAAATYAHFKADVGRDYQRVFWFNDADGIVRGNVEAVAKIGETT